MHCIREFLSRSKAATTLLIPCYQCYEHIIEFTKIIIHVLNVTTSGTNEFPLKKCSYHYGNSAGLQYEAVEIRRCLLEGTLLTSLSGRRGVMDILSA
ncbi:hypothetical protein DPMN_178704 [Dreissena polymorpha]|uniref:Uncharacterized protein n=1 Tax=Dreissena polymorpha TaxID=45954 RepID=A0A9D4EB44_DREPO|nr:hypothetical protein DPMN_178704 [Dreissena polymorpha]